MKTKSVSEKNRSLLKSIATDLVGFAAYDEVSSFAADRQFDRMAKRLSSDDPLLKAKAVELFLAMNNKAKEVVVELDPEIAGNAKYFIQRNLERFTSRYASGIQNDLDLGLLCSLWRHGPGSSNAVKGTHFADKILQPMTVTSKCFRYAELIRKLTPCLNLHDKMCEQTEVTIQNGSQRKTVLATNLVICETSKLDTVPKNADIARTIAIEPSGNMAGQLAAGMYLEGTLRCAGVDIKTQAPRNNLLAQIGSIDGSLATIDMKSASDLITLQLVKVLLPASWFSLLTSLRSEQIELPDGDVTELHMVSTMGNGFTFPLMTLIFLSLCYGVSRKFDKESRELWLDYTKWGVFGDDIICPTEYAPVLFEVLTSCGLIINTDKSYVEGPFRESCGGDYFNGVLVTPFYIESLLNNAEIYCAINKVATWSARNRIPMYSTLYYLLSLLQGRPFLVPEWEDDTSGIQTQWVGKRYKRLKPKVVQKVRPVKNRLDLLCILGGYVECTKDGSMQYRPRVKRVDYYVDNARLPKGYLTGRCRLFICSDEISIRRSQIIEILM